ncbi:hypothetical protein Tco_0838143 [Tanacetum coccineum]|uniref:Uncharacterized protein n=1 Tax=Tanacetum coccineum TaxID=301880 RepID=A0ABQ5ALY9_9ASTR
MELTKPKKYSELSAQRQIQADCDTKATISFSSKDYQPGSAALLQPIRLTQSTLSNSSKTLTQNTQFQSQVSPYQSPQYGSPHQSQQYSTHQSSTPLSITYPSNDYQSSIHHNVYSPSSSIPQLEYAPSVNQQPKFSQPDSGLIVLVFQKGDDPIDAINHIWETNVFTAGTTRTYTPRSKGAILGNKGTSYMIQLQREGHMFPNSALNLNGNGNNLGLKDKVWYADDLDAYDSYCDEIQQLPKLLSNGDLTHYGLKCSFEMFDHSETEINSDSNIIPYSQHVIESQHATVQNSNFSTQQDALILSVIEQLNNQTVEQHRLESKTFEVKMNQVLNKNERLLEQVISKDIVNTIVNSSVDIASVNVHECEKCLKLETELLNKKDFVEKEIYDTLLKFFTTLEKHCISLEVDSQLNQEIFQRNNFVSNQSAPSFDQLFELNELKAQSQEKNTVIKKLKE